MRTLFLTLLVAAALWATWAGLSSPAPTYAPPTPEAPPPPAPQVLTSDPAAGESVQVFAVDGMCCRTCTGKLWASVRDVEGVRAAAVSFDAKEARVIVPEGFDPAPLLAALNVDKYSAKILADGP